jgi:hypothetical protein
MKQILFATMVMTMLALSSCAYGRVNYHTQEGTYDGHTTVTELSYAITADRRSAADAERTRAEADRIRAQAEVNRAAADAIRKNPDLLRDVPLPGNPNDARGIYRESGDCKGNCGGYGSIEENMRQAERDACRRNPQSSFCR